MMNVTVCMLLSITLFFSSMLYVLYKHGFKIFKTIDQCKLVTAAALNDQYIAYFLYICIFYKGRRKLFNQNDNINAKF